MYKTMKFNRFAVWLIETTLQEAVLRFSDKYRDKDANEVPPGFWHWVGQKMDENPKFTPRIEDDDGSVMTRQRVFDLVNARSQNQRWGNNPPAPAPAPQPQQQQPEKPAGDWVLAKVVNVPGMSPGDHVVATRNGEQWTVMDRKSNTKNIPMANIAGAIESVKEDGKVVRSANPEDLWKKVPVAKPQEEKGVGKNPHLMDMDQLSEEQKQIDAQFERMMKSPHQNHMMISALAGTGKTSLLKHLAWKYGKPGQKWLYLVFNTKNRVEAKESSGGWKKFPEWVDIYTTNSFLGHVLKQKENQGIIPQTDRMISLNAGNQGGKVPDKAKVIVDSRTFYEKMTDDFKLPDNEKMGDTVPRLVQEFGINPRDKFFEIYVKRVEGIIDSIRYNFKERVLTLLGLLKSFAVNPKKPNYEQDIKRVFEKYDAHTDEDGNTETGFFDTHLEDIKERISKYDPRFRDTLLAILNEALGYDFMRKDYKEEIIAGATWMLHQALPKASQEKYKYRPKGAVRDIEVNLGDYRDFDDDIWFPTANYIEEIQFPAYQIVALDEVQDFNEGQKIMIKKLIEKGAKVIAVGDKNQSIYNFRGSDSESFDKIGELLKDMSHDKEGWKPHSLSLNFRSRKDVLDHVNNVTHVKDLKAGKKFKDTDLPAEVTDHKVKYSESFNTIAKERAVGKKVETAYISKTNAPLVQAALKLLGNGVPFVILGKDVSGDLVKHLTKIMNKKGMTDDTPLPIFLEALIFHERKESQENAKYSTKKEYLANLKDITMAIETTAGTLLGDERNSRKTIRDYKNWLKEKIGGNSFDFDQSDDRASEADLAEYRRKMEEEKPVVLTTAHKSKGMEYERVYIIDKENFFSPRRKHPEEKKQEMNAWYVGLTRARHQLHILDMEKKK